MYSNFYPLKKFQDPKKEPEKNWYDLIMYDQVHLHVNTLSFEVFNTQYLQQKRSHLKQISHQDQTQSAVDKKKTIKSHFGVAFISKSSVLSLCTKKLNITKHVLCPWFECATTTIIGQFSYRHNFPFFAL